MLLYVVIAIVVGLVAASGLVSHQVFCYSAANAAGATLADTPYIGDESFPGVNSHLFVYDQYDLQALCANGVSLTAVQLDTPLWDSVNPVQVYPVNLSLEPPGNPQILDLRRRPLALPRGSEVVCRISNNLGAATEVETVVGWMTPRGWTPPPIPGPGMQDIGLRVRILVNATAVLTANTWSPFVNVVIDNGNLREGVYVVLGMDWFVPSAIAYKTSYNQVTLVNGTKLYPGGLTQHAYGDVPLRQGPDFMGPQGAFNTIFLPQVSFFGQAAAGSTKYFGIIDAIRVSDDINAIRNYT